MSDILRITILGDGTVRTETDRISGPNHQSAEDFLTQITLLTGGDGMRNRKGAVHVHNHQHEHEGTDGHKH